MTAQFYDLSDQEITTAAYVVKEQIANGSIKFIRNFWTGSIKGIWVKEFPSEVSEAAFLLMFCASRGKKNRKEYAKINMNEYHIIDSNKNKGYKVLFT